MRVPLYSVKPNAGPQPRLEAGARHERRLEGVGCRPMLGSEYTTKPQPGFNNPSLLGKYTYVLWVSVRDSLVPAARPVPWPKMP